MSDLQVVLILIALVALILYRIPKMIEDGMKFSRNAAAGIAEPAIQAMRTTINEQQELLDDQRVLLKARDDQIEVLMTLIRDYTNIPVDRYTGEIQATPKDDSATP